MKGLRHVYEHLQPYKLNTEDKAPVCPDYCVVSADCIDTAGLKEAELRKLPIEVYLGEVKIETPSSFIGQPYYLFSKSALGAMLGDL